MPKVVKWDRASWTDESTGVEFVATPHPSGRDIAVADVSDATEFDGREDVQIMNDAEYAAVFTPEGN